MVGFLLCVFLCHGGKGFCGCSVLNMGFFYYFFVGGIFGFWNRDKAF